MAREFRIAELSQSQDGAGFAPRGAAAQLWRYRGPEVMLSGPAETGKTWSSLQKLDALMWKYSGAQSVIVRKSQKSINSSVLQTYRRIIGEDSPVKPYGGQNPEWYDYPNGSRIWIAGMDNPQKALSSERDFIYINQAEELELPDYQTLRTRNTGRGGVAPYAQTFGDCNPGPATHWIMQREAEGHLKVLHSRHEDNPTLFDEAGNITEQGRRSLAVLDSLTGVLKQRLRYGLWTGAEGMVYEEWDRKVHVKSAADLKAWRVIEEEAGKGELLKLNREVIRSVYATVDWGFTNPGVIQVWAVDGDGRQYLIREIYRTLQLIDWWVQQAKDLRAHFGIELFICDPAEPGFISQFSQAGLPAIGAFNKIMQGVQALQARLSIGGDGRARFYVYRDCLAERDPDLDEKKKPCGLVEEIDGYVWQKTAEGKPNKEEPVDNNNHALDCARYMSAHLDIAQVKAIKFKQKIYR